LHIFHHIGIKREEEHDYAPSGFRLLFRHHPAEHDGSLWTKLNKSKYKYSHTSLNYNYAITCINSQPSNAALV
jgi:hypothetical protein